MKKIFFIAILFLIFGLLYFRAENPRSHFSKYQSKEEPKKEKRNPANTPQKKSIQNKINKTDALQSKFRKINKIKSLKNQKIINQIPSNKKELYAKSPILKLKNGAYKLLDSVGIIEKKYRNQVNSEDILAEKLGYLFVKDYEQRDLEALGVVQNQDNREYGILTGIVSIKFKDYKQRDDTLRKIAGTVEKDFSHLSILMVRYQDYQQLAKDYNFLASSSQVKRANIEIIEYAKSGK